MYSQKKMADVIIPFHVNVHCLLNLYFGILKLKTKFYMQLANSCLLKTYLTEMFILWILSGSETYPPLGY